MTVSNIVFITTSSNTPERAESYRRLVNSVFLFVQKRADINVSLFALIQNSQQGGIQSLPSFVHEISICGRVPPSDARNYVLSRIDPKYYRTSDCIVLFPDDDCWYPDDFLEAITLIFSRMDSLDFWLCRYASSPVQLGSDDGVNAKAAHVIRRASANTIVIRGSLITADMRFDTKLGINTLYLGGEDTDFALKVFKKARQTRYVDRPCIGHRDASIAHAARYYEGALVAMCQNVEINGVRREIIRKLLVGVVQLFAGRIAIATYGTCLLVGMRSLMLNWYRRSQS